MTEKTEINLSELGLNNPAWHNTVWDDLFNNKSIGRIAYGIWPDKTTVDKIKNKYNVNLDDEKYRPEKWKEALTDQIYSIRARLENPGDYFPALFVPRFVHGQSQGICDIYGIKVVEQEDGNYFPFPLPPDPKLIEDIKPEPLQKSIYWGAVEWIKYAKKSTNNVLPIRIPVLTGPFDTANYILGTTVLLEWVYLEPKTLHVLLDKITKVIISTIEILKDAAGGSLESEETHCVRGGFSICSELRSQISAEMYREFEAPYLRQIGEKCGPYCIHSCGSWERTISSALEDPNLRVMNGQVRENDLKKLCELAAGKKTLSINPSINLNEKYTWNNIEDYYKYIIEIVPDTQPFETNINEKDVSLWKNLYYEIKGKKISG